jgi:hypothetical protein
VDARMIATVKLEIQGLFEPIYLKISRMQHQPECMKPKNPDDFK